MLLKLFKYDFRKVMRFVLIMAIIIAGVTVMGSASGAVIHLLIKFQPENVSVSVDLLSGMLAAICTMLVYVSCLAPGVCVTVFVILMYKHFFDDVLSDRGYLTLTLPVTSRQVLASKLFSAVLGQLILEAIASLSVFTTLSVTVLPFTTFDNVINLIKSMVQSVVSLFAAYDLVLMIVLIVLIGITGMFYVYISFYFFMILGYVTAKRRKVGAGIGFFIGGSYLVYIVTYVATVIVSMIYSSFMAVMIDEGTPGAPTTFIILLPAFVILAVLTVVMGIVENKLLENKIDLQ